MKQNIQDVTVNTRLKGIKAFFNFCIELGYMKPFKMDLITVTKKVKEIYTDEELSILTRKPNLRKCKFTEYRNWVITMYLLATGNRASTVRNIKIKDVDLDNNGIMDSIIYVTNIMDDTLSSYFSLLYVVLNGNVYVLKNDKITDDNFYEMPLYSIKAVVDINGKSINNIVIEKGYFSNVNKTGNIMYQYNNDNKKYEIVIQD